MDKYDFLQRFNLSTPYEIPPYHFANASTKAPPRPAAVLIGLVERTNGLHVILTKRAAHLRHHPGQVSFPGGKVEPEDPSAYATAVREAWEEVGIMPSQVSLIGELPTFDTISRFSVTPVIANIDRNYKTKIDHNEVESVFEVPASFLLNPNNLHQLKVPRKNRLHHVFAVPYEQHLIWGVTAQIVHALQLQLHNKLAPTA
ncbi:CoA pyrophosphatase [Vibrio sp. SCSIO 43136]|uniref:CoA pyrophosphatase n=1 Tax=Vibrio sp. SCSIO 43136 TaxID=2819101 RepID=UPI002076160B|nr:CoA pyrophosphatase [Vibrio sp. SCSIO 43136]USD66436.1 CoA pyrophosphatase [Vibrio sp. SCSIO 43136]